MTHLTEARCGFERSSSGTSKNLLMRFVLFKLRAAVGRSNRDGLHGVAAHDHAAAQAAGAVQAVFEAVSAAPYGAAVGSSDQRIVRRAG